MTPRLFVDLALAPGLSLLPPHMDTRAARAMLIAICLQESQLRHRRQGNDGPARGYPQFETGGVHAVFNSARTDELAVTVCLALDVPPRIDAIHTAMEWCDPLAVCFARLLLWTLPQRLARQDEPDRAFLDYLKAWQPRDWKKGLKFPRYKEWGSHYTVAWATVLEGT
jgi:hypothetical protein